MYHIISPDFFWLQTTNISIHWLINIWFTQFTARGKPRSTQPAPMHQKGTERILISIPSCPPFLLPSSLPLPPSLSLSSHSHLTLSFLVEGGLAPSPAPFLGGRGASSLPLTPSLPLSSLSLSLTPIFLSLSQWKRS